MCIRGRNRIRLAAEIRRRTQLKMLFSLLVTAIMSTSVERRIWTRERSSVWWERIVLGEFSEEDWQQNFRVRKHTFDHICDQLRPRLNRRNTHMRRAIQVEKRVGVALWWLAIFVWHCRQVRLYPRSLICLAMSSYIILFLKHSVNLA